MSKYEPLWIYLKKEQKDSFKLSFDDILNILGFKIDHSFLKYKNEAKDYGYEVIKISLKEKYIIISKYKIKEVRPNDR